MKSVTTITKIVYKNQTFILLSIDSSIYYLKDRTDETFLPITSETYNYFYKEYRDYITNHITHIY